MSAPKRKCGICGEYGYEIHSPHDCVAPLLARIAELEARVREQREAICNALQALPRQTWADTSRGRGIGGQAITSEYADEYDARLHEQVIRPLQLLLERSPLIGG